MASSSSSGSREMIRLEDLQWGVVQTFKPTDAELVGHYLYGKIMMGQARNGKQSFPELDVYGKNGMVPWVIWESLEPIRFPHQEFSYFFTRVKKLSTKGTGKRCSRTIGNGGTWSETEPAKPVYVHGFEKPFGKMRKFKYENSDKEFEHHCAWMMEEFSIDHSLVASLDLVLCRMKRNCKNNYKRKRNSVEDEEANAKRRKSLQAEKQLVSHPHHEIEQQQQCQLSDSDVQELVSVHDLFCGGSVVEQVGVEQRSTSSSVGQQLSHAPQFDNNHNCTADDMIVSQNESENAVLEDDTGWLDDIEWEADIEPSLSEDHSSVGHDLIITVNEATHSQLEEEGTESTDQNGFESEAEGGQTLPPALVEQHSSSSPLMLQQHDLSSTNDDQAFAFAFDDEVISMDGASYFQSDECSNFYFEFEDQYLSGEATLPQSVPHLGETMGYQVQNSSLAKF